jgi:hypothetical protein
MQSQPDPTPSVLKPFALAVLCMAGLMVAMFLREQRELEDQLRIERGRRGELEDAAREREVKLDGALDTIKRLADERDAAE